MSSIKDKLARVETEYEWLPDGSLPNFTLVNDANEEILKSGKTSGHKSRSLRKNVIGTGILGGGTFGYNTAKKMGLKKTGSILGAAGSAAVGGVLGNVAAKRWQKKTAKKHGTKKGERALDNYKVARREMTEEEFNRKWRAFSKSLPSDWDSDDDAYVEMVEKAKSRNRKIAKVGPYIAPAIWGTVGAVQGGVIGDIASGSKSKKGALLGAAVGGLAGSAGSYLTQEAIGKRLKGGTDKKSFRRLSNSDQKAANRAIAKYRNMKTKEERLAWRKKIKSKV